LFCGGLIYFVNFSAFYDLIIPTNVVQILQLRYQVNDLPVLLPVSRFTQTEVYRLRLSELICLYRLFHASVFPPNMLEAIHTVAKWAELEALDN
jgi:hypothetical protein